MSARTASVWKYIHHEFDQDPDYMQIVSDLGASSVDEVDFSLVDEALNGVEGHRLIGVLKTFT